METTTGRLLSIAIAVTVVGVTGAIVLPDWVIRLVWMGLTA